MIQVSLWGEEMRYDDRTVREKKRGIPRVFSAADDLDNEEGGMSMKMTRVLGITSVTYHIEKCPAGEQARQRQALGCVSGV